MEKENKEMKIEIKVDDAMATGVFSNAANITHSSDEFIMDFLFINPTSPPGFGKVVSRVILSPGRAKRLLEALTINVRKYEEKFGEIPLFKPPVEPGKNIIQ